MCFLSSVSFPHEPQSGLSLSLVLKRRSPLVKRFWTRLKRVLLWEGLKPFDLIISQQVGHLTCGLLCSCSVSISTGLPCWFFTCVIPRSRRMFCQPLVVRPRSSPFFSSHTSLIVVKKSPLKYEGILIVSAESSWLTWVLNRVDK